MNKIALALVLIILSLNFTSPALKASKREPSVSGTYQILLEGDISREINFRAIIAPDGNTMGQIDFRDIAAPSRIKVDKSEGSSGNFPAFYAKVACDCLVIEGVEAVLSGSVIESSQQTYVGKRVLLVVQDGDSLSPPLRDKLTFGFYKTSSKSWVSTDGERAENQGPPPSWIATDAERPDDMGTLPHTSPEVTCQTFPLSSYSFVGAKQGKGKIEVKP